MSEPGLTADVTLSIQAALAQVSDIEAALTAAVTDIAVSVDASPVTTGIDEAVASADATVAVQADASGMPETIDEAVAGADATVAVQADTSEASSALDGIESDAEGLDPTIDVTANTSEATSAISDLADQAASVDAEIDVTANTDEAQQAIDDLSESASGTDSGIEALSGHLQALSGAGESAAGAAGAVAGSLAKITPETAAVVAGVGALIGIGKSFVDQSVDAEVSLRRFDLTTGRFADDVRNINVGDLNGDLGELALKLGTSDEAMQDAASKVFQLGTANGTAGKEVANTADQILALGLRARAMNPALGESGQISENLTAAFARGGRALVPYGIALSAAEINVRALADTGKKSATDLTVYDKAAAGAALATEKFGGSLAEALGQAADNPAIRLAVLRNNFQELQERLGAKIQAPVFEALEAAEPIMESFATVIADVLEALTPLLSLGARVAPVFGLIGKAIALQLKPLDLAAEGIGKVVGLFHHESGAAKFAKEVDQATAALTDESGALDLSGKALAAYIEEGARFKDQHQEDDIARIGLSTAQVGDLALKGKAGLDEFRQAAVDAGEGKNVGDLVHSFTDLQKVVDAVAKAQITAAVNSGAITKAQGDAALAANDHVAALKGLEVQIHAHDAAVAEATAVYGPLIQQQQAATQGLDALAVDSAAAHDAVVALGSGVQPTDADLLSFATTMKDAHLSTAAMDESAAALGITTDQLSGFIDGATGALDDFVKSAVDGLPSVSDAFKGTSSIQGFIDNLNSGRDKTAQFMQDLQTIFDAGGHAISGVLAQQGVEGGGAYARTLAEQIGKGDTTLVSNAETAVNAHNAEIQKATEFLTTTFGPEYIATTGQIAALAKDAFSSNLDFATRTRLAAQLAASGLSTEGQAIAVIAANKGQEAAEAYAKLFKIDDKTVAAGEAAAAAIVGDPTLPTAAGQVGTTAGGALAQGLLNSLGSDVPGAVAAAGHEIDAGKPKLGEKGKAAGTHAGSSLAGGVADAAGSGIRGKGVASASDAITGGLGSLTLGQQAATTGSGIGESFSLGVAQGIVKQDRAVKAAATKIIADAEAAARLKAQTGSPSKLMAKVGADMSAGVAKGIDEVAPDVALAAQKAVSNAFADAAAAAKAQQTLVFDPVQQGMLGFARSLDTAKLSADQFEQVARSVGVTTDQLHQFVDGATKAVDDFAASVISKFPQASAAFQGATDTAGFVGNLRQQNIDAEKFMHNVQVIFAAGGKDVAALLAQQGATAGGAYAQELADSLASGDKSLLASAQATVVEHNRIIREMTDEVQNDLAPAFVEATGQILDVANQAGLSGTEAGKAFSDGIAVGISQHTKNVQSAAAQIVADAEAAARKKAQSKSPSRLFALLGEDLAAGLASGLSGEAQQVVAEAEAIVQAAWDATKSQLERTDPGGLIAQALAAAQSTVQQALPALAAIPAGNTQVDNTGGQVSIGSVTFDASGISFPGVTTAEQAGALASEFVSQGVTALQQLQTTRAVQVALRLQGPK